MQQNTCKLKLAFKISGLALIIGAIWMAVNTFGVYFHQTGDSKISLATAAPAASGAQIESSKQVDHKNAKEIFSLLAFKSLLPLVFGIYLTMSHNLHSMLTYPAQLTETDMDPAQFSVGFPDGAETPEVSFKLGHMPCELNEFKAFFDRSDGFLSPPPAFK